MLRRFLTITAACAALLALLAACGPKASPASSGDQQLTASGLKYVIIEQGTGPQAKAGDTVTVKYTGKLDDGTVFDSGDYTFVLGTGQVIPGWDEGIALLNEGGKATLIIPPDLAYGPQGNGPIPPNATLTFDVELTDIQ
jgi:FKBP-type peptidyl-prolyl cis-trans isomerase